MTKKRNSSKSKAQTDRPRDYGLVALPLSIADQEAIKKGLVSNAAAQVDAFPKLQATLLALLRRVYPIHLIAIVGQYGLFSPVSNQGIGDRTLVADIQQHHVELLQAFALTLNQAEWGAHPATPGDVEIVIETVKSLADAFHARRFLEAQQVEEKQERYQLLLREKMRLTVSFSNRRGTQAISRTSVDQDLNGFLAYLERSSSSSDDVVDHVIGSFQASQTKAQVGGDARFWRRWAR